MLRIPKGLSHFCLASLALSSDHLERRQSSGGWGTCGQGKEIEKQLSVPTGSQILEKAQIFTLTPICIKKKIA